MEASADRALWWFAGDEAGSAYRKLSDCHIKLESPHEAATALQDGANAYKKVDMGQAKQLLGHCAELYCNMGRLNMAGKSLRETAELCEKAEDKPGALEFYEKAMDLYMTEEMASEVNKCLTKIGQVAAELGDLKKAVMSWEDLAKKSIDNNLLKYSVKGYLLNAGICVMSGGDMEAINNAVERYDDLDATFSGTREYTLLKGLAEAMEAGDEDAFTAAVAEFDNMTRLEPWKTSLLLDAKRKIASIEAQEEDLC